MVRPMSLSKKRIGTVSTIQGLVHRQENMDALSESEVSSQPSWPLWQSAFMGTGYPLYACVDFQDVQTGIGLTSIRMNSYRPVCLVKFVRFSSSDRFLHLFSRARRFSMYWPSRLLCRSICLSIAGWLSAPYSWASAKNFAYLAEMDFTINAFQ